MARTMYGNSCGWTWSPFGGSEHYCRRRPGHASDHECECGMTLSGTPAGGPGVSVDDGADAPSGNLAEPVDAATPTPAPSSLTAEMQVARCRVLLDQWRKERLQYQLHGMFAQGLYAATEHCEDELREALEGS